jgi:eukaryotic-like serine/threonine-protein kinase
LARAHHAMVLKAMGRLDEAVTEAEQALELIAMAPTFRSMGNAALADALLAKGDVARALEVAEAASAQLSGGGASEADSYVRLVHVKALRAAGRLEDFRLAATRARAILFSRADAITDPTLRKCFLESVSENVETLELASSLGP